MYRKNKKGIRCNVTRRRVRSATVEGGDRQKNTIRWSAREVGKVIAAARGEAILREGRLAHCPARGRRVQSAAVARHGKHRYVPPPPGDRRPGRMRRAATARIRPDRA